LLGRVLDWRSGLLPVVLQLRRFGNQFCLFSVGDVLYFL